TSGGPGAVRCWARRFVRLSTRGSRRRKFRPRPNGCSAWPHSMNGVAESTVRSDRTDSKLPKAGFANNPTNCKAYISTGTTSGVGRRTALELAQHGTVVLVARTRRRHLRWTGSFEFQQSRWSLHAPPTHFQSTRYLPRSTVVPSFP